MPREGKKACKVTQQGARRQELSPGWLSDTHPGHVPVCRGLEKVIGV